MKNSSIQLIIASLSALAIAIGCGKEAQEVKGTWTDMYSGKATTGSPGHIQDGAITTTLTIEDKRAVFSKTCAFGKEAVQVSVEVSIEIDRAKMEVNFLDQKSESKPVKLESGSDIPCDIASFEKGTLKYQFGYEKVFDSTKLVFISQGKAVRPFERR